MVRKVLLSFMIIFVFIYIIIDHSKSLYLHQTFADYMSNQYTYTDISTCQMSQKVIECISIFIPLFANFAHNWQTFKSKVNFFLCQTFTDCLSNQKKFLICWYDRCNYKLRKVSWFKWVLWKFYCLMCYSSSKAFIKLYEDGLWGPQGVPPKFK